MSAANARSKGGMSCSAPGFVASRFAALVNRRLHKLAIEFPPRPRMPQHVTESRALPLHGNIQFTERCRKLGELAAFVVQNVHRAAAVQPVEKRLPPRFFPPRDVIEHNARETIRRGDDRRKEIIGIPLHPRRLPRNAGRVVENDAGRLRHPRLRQRCPLARTAAPRQRPVLMRIGHVRKELHPPARPRRKKQRLFERRPNRRAAADRRTQPQFSVKRLLGRIRHENRHDVELLSHDAPVESPLHLLDFNRRSTARAEK